VTLEHMILIGRRRAEGTVNTLRCGSLFELLLELGQVINVLADHRRKESRGESHT